MHFKYPNFVDLFDNAILLKSAKYSLKSLRPKVVLKVALMTLCMSTAYSGVTDTYADKRDSLRAQQKTEDLSKFRKDKASVDSTAAPTTEDEKSPADNAASSAKATDTSKAEPLLKSEEKKESSSSETSPAQNKDEIPPQSPKDIAYSAGTISLKPLTVHFGAMTFGFHRKNSVINNFAVNTHNSSPGWLGNRSERNGLGWDLELGYYPLDNFEIFGIVGFTYERPFSQVAVGPLNSQDVTAQWPQFAFNFKPKFSFTTSLGSRYYWAIQDSKWVPFVGALVNVTQQDATHADVSKYNFFAATRSLALGPIRLQGRRTVFGYAIQAGADYCFNNTVALSIFASLQYSGTTPVTTTRAYGATFSYKDNRNTLIVPVLASLKITL